MRNADRAAEGISVKNLKLASIACFIALTGCQGLNILDSCDQANSYELCYAERKAKIDKILKSQAESNSSSKSADTPPELEIRTDYVTPGPLPDWIMPPPADAIVTEALVTLTNPTTGEQFTVPTGGYTINLSASEDSDAPSAEPRAPASQ